MERRVRHPGSALGEAIGKLIEADLAAAVRQVAESFNHSVRSVSLRNHMGKKDTLAPAKAWQRFCPLSEQEREGIAAAITDPVRQAVRHSVETILQSDPNAPKRVEAVELSIRTSEGEHLVYSFDSVREAIQRLVAFVKDIEDLGHIMR